MVMDNKNYTLGRGKVYFSRFKAGTQIPAGFFYIGNTPEFNLTIESEVLITSPRTKASAKRTTRSRCRSTVPDR